MEKNCKCGKCGPTPSEEVIKILKEMERKLEEMNINLDKVVQALEWSTFDDTRDS